MNSYRNCCLDWIVPSKIQCEFWTEPLKRCADKLQWSQEDGQECKESRDPALMRESRGIYGSQSLWEYTQLFILSNLYMKMLLYFFKLSRWQN